MIEIKSTPYSSTASVLASAIATAEYYGFKPMELMQKNDHEKRPLTSEDIARIESALTFARKEERALNPVARKLVSLARPDHGVLLAWRITKGSGSTPSMNLELHVFGTTSVFAEALLLVVTRSILKQFGIKSHRVSINNIGTNESSGRFIRDVGIFLRKHIDSISPSLRSRAESDPIGTLVQLIEKGHPAIHRAPQPLEYLNEDERRRLWTFLDFLETLGINYEIDGQILGSRECWSHTLFEVSGDQEDAPTCDEPFAFGGRYDALASRYARKTVGAVMVTMPFEVRGSTEMRTKRTQKPSLFYAYIGPEAQKKSLTILNTLHQANIRIGHELWHPTMHDQMRAAKLSGSPYIIIMGHKEALEDTVIVREVATNFQDTIPAHELVTYLEQRVTA